MNRTVPDPAQFVNDALADLRPTGAACKRTGRSGVPLGYSVHKRRDVLLAYYSKGVQIHAPYGVMSQTAGSGRPPVKRGSISAFSAKSRRRLREVLLTSTAPVGWLEKGFTLTIPGPVLPESDFRRLWHRFQHIARESGYTLIWRIELQERKQVHLHGTVFVRDERAANILYRSWEDALSVLGPVEWKGQSCENRFWLAGAFEHSCQVESAESGKASWYRYLCDHASKRKQAQLGWKGRQWGVVGRSTISREQPSEVGQLTPKQFDKFLRCLRRLTRSHVWRGRRGTSTWFCSPETVRRIVAWAKTEC